MLGCSECQSYTVSGHRLIFCGLSHSIPKGFIHKDMSFILHIFVRFNSYPHIHICNYMYIFNILAILLFSLHKLGIEFCNVP